MTIKIDTDAIESVLGISVVGQFIHQAGLEIFNNLGTNTPEYAEVCDKLRASCDKISARSQELKALIPVVSGVTAL